MNRAPELIWLVVLIKKTVGIKSPFHTNCLQKRCADVFTFICSPFILRLIHFAGNLDRFNFKSWERQSDLLDFFSYGLLLGLVCCLH